ncbi:hypothetical protein [Borrelia hispanica]|uniref:hypothetical protein n=1 Tax=Borrelia hispanica TaxID=40835 RepID=UPI000467B2A5|nr:hypothetical protein [Borrelia hispanica]
MILKINILVSSSALIVSVNDADILKAIVSVNADAKKDSKVNKVEDVFVLGFLAKIVMNIR